MSNMQRNKGQRGEREVIELLQPVVIEVYQTHGIETIPLLQRNTIQSDRGGYDIVGLDWLALEVKRGEQHNRYRIDQWWTQCEAQAGNREPVLFYRANHEEWKVRLYGMLFTWREIGGGLVRHGRTITVPVTVDVDSFLSWFRARLNWELYKCGY